MSGDKQRLYLIVAIMETYKEQKSITGREVLKLFETKGILKWLIEFYDVIHLQSIEHTLEDITEIIENGGRE